MLNQRLARLFGIIILLRSKEWVSAKDLSKHFNVTLRTIYRDISAIQENNIPVEGIPGPDGGYRLNAEGSIDPTLFTNDEAFGLYLIGSGTQSTNNFFRQKIEPILNKLKDTVDRKDLEIIRLSKERIYFDTEDWYWKSDSFNLIPRIREALFKQAKIKIEIYKRGTKDKEVFTILPLGLVWKGGQWYLVGRNIETSSINRYRVSRIITMQILKGKFSYPNNFNLKEWWNSELEEFGKGEIEINLLVKPDAFSELNQITLKNNSKISYLGESIHLTLYVDKWQWLLPLLLSYSGSIIVLKPLELRKEIITIMKNTINEYDKGFPENKLKYLNDDSRKRATLTKEYNNG